MKRKEKKSSSSSGHKFTEGGRKREGSVRIISVSGVGREIPFMMAWYTYVRSYVQSRREDVRKMSIIRFNSGSETKSFNAV